MTRCPAKSPCVSCPYRCDVPSGVWAEEEYVLLPLYDGPLWTQPPSVFMCHQQNRRICAGWAGCHDMIENLGMRLIAEHMTREDIDATVDYVSPVPLFGSGAEAARHGMAEILEPGARAREMIRALNRKLV